jgi:tetratricopeptide (TPR) repeat protein/transcriptional regulator with XRE-family HTH domain
MKSRSSRWQPLPEGLSPGEREFFVELRRLVEAAGLTYRELEKKTSTARTDAADPVFYSKSQWARWLNGQAMPPRRALRRLAEVLTGDDLPAAQLLVLWDRGDSGGHAEQSEDAPVPPRQLPSVTPQFIGRAPELARLEETAEHAASGGATEVVVITGTAGVGKTTLANYFCQRVAARFPDGQLHVNLRGFDPGGQPLDASAALRGFLEGLGVKPESVRDDIGAQAALYRTLVAGRRLLIVLDNAAGIESVRPLIPGSPGCLVVVTSRNELSGLIAQGARILTLAPFTEGDAWEFLEHRLGTARLEREPEAAAELIKRCVRLPLAMGVAAAYAVTRPSFPLSALAAQLRDRALDQLDTGDKETSARTVFSWSYDALSEQGKRMFRLLGVHPGPDTSVPAAASLAGIAAGPAHMTLGELSRAHLADEHAPGRFAVHDLLRAYAAELAGVVDGTDSLRAAERRLLDHYLHTGHAAALQLVSATDFGGLTRPAAGTVIDPPRTVDEAMAWYSAESAALLAACAHAAEHDLAPYNWQLPWTIAPYLIDKVRWADSAATQRAAAASAERTGEQRGLGYARYHLAQALDLSGHGKDAEQQLSRALDAFTAVGDTVGQGLALYGLSKVLQGQDRYEEALPVARESLRLRTAQGVPAAVATSENTLGAICAKLGRYAEAVAHCERALRISEAAGLGLHQAGALYFLGLAHSRAGEYPAAASAYRQAAEVYREISAVPDLATTLTLLANAEEAAGDTAAARLDRAAADAILDGMPPGDAEQVRAWIKRESAPPPARWPASDPRAEASPGG